MDIHKSNGINWNTIGLCILFSMNCFAPVRFRTCVNSLENVQSPIMIRYFSLQNNKYVVIGNKAQS